MTFKHRVRRSFTVLLVAALGLVVSAAAEAARHDVRGCIFLLDDREFSPTFGAPVPVQGVEMEFDYTVGAATHTAVSVGTPPATNASGCFSVRLTLVPANTTITARMVLNRVADRKVLNSDGDTYAFELSSVSVTGNGQNVDYGDVVGASGGSNDPVLMWVNATDAQSHYSDFAGPYGNQGFRQLRVEFPSPGDGSFFTNEDHTIHIFQGNRARFKTFMHEFGHFIASEDSTSSGNGGDYCQGPSATMYPFDEVPYDYIDPDPCSDAGHHDRSWEHESRAMSEGFADFVGDFLNPRFDTNTGQPIRDVGECKEKLGLNFDDIHREQNIAHALCDLVDRGHEEVMWMHALGEEGQVEWDYAIGLTSSAGMSSRFAFGSDGKDVFRIEFATRYAIYFASPVAMGTIDRVTADDLRACYTDGSQVRCTDMNYQEVIVTLPCAPCSVVDLQLDAGELVLLVNSFALGRREVYRSPYGAWSWTSVFAESLLGLPNSELIVALEVDLANNELYLARRHRVQQCPLNTCSASSLQNLAGRTYEGGYARGDALSSLLFEIKQLILDPVQQQLFVVDDYGVAVFRRGPPDRLKQYVGRGGDNVFVNNLSRRGIGLCRGTVPFFATDGVLEYIEADCIKTFDTARVETQAAEAYFVDGSLDTEEDFLCAQENVEIDPEDVLQMYRGEPFYQSSPSAFSAISGLSGVDQRAVERVNWVELPLDACETHDFGTRIVDFSVSGGPPPALEADSEDGDGCAGILPGDDSGSDEDEGRQEDDFDVEPGMEGPEEPAPIYDPPARLEGSQARNRSCGLGFELCLLLPLLLGAQRRRRAKGSGA